MRLPRHRRGAALATTIVTLGLVAVLGLAASPAGAALRPLESQALRALAGTRPVIDASAAGCAVASGGACIPASVALGSTFTLADRVGITGQVTATCGPFLSNGFFSFGSVSLSVDQAAGRSVAHASASTTATCDGSPHTYTLTAIAQNVPFRPGGAVATGSVSANGVDFSFTFVEEDASVSQSVTLSR